jgi:hypothetical protein
MNIRWNRERRGLRETKMNWNRCPIHPTGEPLSSFSFGVFRAFRGLNCRFQDEFFA